MNQWYLFRKSSDEKITGTHPQTDGMKYGYDLRKVNSIWNLPNKKLPDFDPDFDHFVLDKKAKLTDIISTGLISASGLIVSEKIKEIFSLYRLPDHKYFKAKVSHKKIVYNDYYWLHFISDNVTLIDFKKSEFIRRDTHFDDDQELLTVANASDLLKERQITSLRHIFPKTLQLLNHEAYDFLYFNDFWNKYYINEKLLNKLKDLNCSGFDYIKISFQLNEIN